MLVTSAVRPRPWLWLGTVMVMGSGLAPLHDQGPSANATRHSILAGIGALLVLVGAVLRYRDYRGMPGLVVLEGMEKELHVSPRTAG